VAVEHKLTSLPPGLSETQSEYGIVQASFQEFQEVLAGDAWSVESLLHIGFELAFHDTIDMPRFLLLTKLKPAVRRSPAAASLITWSSAPFLYGTAGRKAALSLEE